MKRLALRRIVCAVGLADRSRTTMTHAIALARLHEAELRLLYVMTASTAQSDAVQRRGRETLLALRRLTRGQDGTRVPARAVVSHGDPGIEVSRYATRVRADLVIIGRSRSARNAVGAVDGAILRATKCPVLVVPGRSGAAHAPTGRFREIVCGVSSDLSRTVLGFAVSLVQDVETRLTVLQVEGDPAQELATAAERLRADLVVVGSTGMPDEADSSVALNTLARTTCSVLVVPLSGRVPRKQDLVAERRVRPIR